VPLNISLPDFDKGARCPGWSGEGWKFNDVDWCDGVLPPSAQRWALTVRENPRRRPRVTHATELRGFFSWRLRRTNCCNTIVLPQATFWLAPGSWVGTSYASAPAVRSIRQALSRLRLLFRR
jgi:hypothetical protein